MVAAIRTHGRVWENWETLLHLQKWGNENIQMKLLSCTRKRPIWKEIGNFIWVAGYEDQEEDAWKTRIHTSVSVYHTYKDKCEKTRNGALKRKLAFFDEVGEFPPINKSFADWRARQDFFTILEKIYLRKTRRRKAGEKDERRPNFCSNWHKYFLKSTCFQQFHLCSYLPQFELV